MTPPSALTSSTAIWVAASISWASSAIGPVMGTTTPSFRDCWPSARRLTKGNAETAVAAPAPTRPFRTVRREVRFIGFLHSEDEIETADAARLYHGDAAPSTSTAAAVLQCCGLQSARHRPRSGGHAHERRLAQAVVDGSGRSRSRDRGHR